MLIIVLLVRRDLEKEQRELENDDTIYRTRQYDAESLYDEIRDEDVGYEKLSDQQYAHLHDGYVSTVDINY